MLELLDLDPLLPLRRHRGGEVVLPVAHSALANKGLWRKIKIILRFFLGKSTYLARLGVVKDAKVDGEVLLEVVDVQVVVELQFSE